MKKIVSILIAFAVILSAISVSTITSFAQEWEDRRNIQDSAGYVNGTVGGNISTEYDSATEGLKITYGGEGTLTGWEFPLLAEGQDYDVLSEDIDNNVIIIKLLDGGRGEIPYINALVDFSNETVTKESESETQAKLNTDDTADEKSAADTEENTEDEFTMDVTFDLLADNAAEKTEANGAKTIIIAVAAGAAVCIVVLLVLKIKKSKLK